MRNKEKAIQYVNLNSSKMYHMYMFISYTRTLFRYITFYSRISMDRKYDAVYIYIYKY